MSRTNVKSMTRLSCENPLSLLPYALLVAAATVLWAQQSIAACGCQIGGNQIYIVGQELLATSCPPTPHSDATNYTYVINAINCDGTKLSKYAPYGDTWGSPATITSFYVSRGYRVIRNPSGTHFIVVQSGTYPFSGTVSGVSMAGKPAGVYFTEPPESANEFCTYQPLPDRDGDHFADCLDCSVSDPGQNAVCTSEARKEANLGPECPSPR